MHGCNLRGAMVIARRTIRLTKELDLDPYVTSATRHLVQIEDIVTQQNGVTHG